MNEQLVKRIYIKKSVGRKMGERGSNSKIK
jgi:hypothetical protein